MIYEADEDMKKKLLPLFQNMGDTIILACLRGNMGTAWGNDPVNPTAGQVRVGSCIFFAGDFNSEAVYELIHNLPQTAAVVTDNNGWNKCIETTYEGIVKKFSRYAFRKTPEHFDYNLLKSFISAVPKGYELKKVDAAIAHEPSFTELSEGFTEQFKSIDDFVDKGVGYCIMHNGQVVCGATSYTVYDDGIEIQIFTHPDHRRKGLASAAASALILDCLDRGKYPSWDAANLNSVALAQKLGYILKGPYDAYFIQQKNS